MATLCKHFKISARLCAGLFALLCCAASYGVRADDLYFSPKKQKEIDRQNAVLKAYHDSIRAAQRPAVNDYTATWSNFDSVDHRGYRGIYELSQNQEQPNEDEPERESYADRLRFEDQTYVVLVREPYYPWWGWGYPSWGVSWGSWGWNAGWNYPYYSWGYPYYGWNYYGYGYGYGWGWSYPYYGYGYSYNHRPVRYANSQHRGSNVSGTGGNSGYTNRPSQRTSSSLSLPSSGYTQRTQGEYTRPSQGAAGSSSGSNTVYSSSGRSYQSIQQERSQQNSNSSWGSRNTSSQSYSSGSSSSSSSSSSSYSGGSRSSGGSSSGSSGGSRRGGSGR